MRKLVAAALLALVALAGFAEGAEPSANPLAFQAGLNLGTDVLPTGPGGTSEAWTKLGFQPDIAFGKFGIGVDLTLRFKLYPSPDQAVEIYPDDWVPDYNGNGKSFFDIYLPKLLYVRYGVKGEDPLYAKLGSIADLTLGNGFIMGSYSNMSFMPETRLFGLNVGVDGALVNFPYLGLELATGNLARFDVIGARLYARPLVGTSIPIIKNAQLGLTLVVDRDPYLYIANPSSIPGLPAASKPVTVYGADLTVPILGGKLFPLAAFADIAFEPNDSMGAMLGFGGRLLGLFTYGAQIRFLQEGFIPAYFDGNYDLYRAFKYAYMDKPSGGDMFAGWYASLGTSLIKDKLVFLASLDGPFKPIPTPATENQADYPHAKALARLGEGIIGGFYFDASYEKYYLGKVQGFWEDLVDPTDAVIGLAVNYKTGASVLTLKYDAKWDAAKADFVVTSTIQASMKF